MPLPEDLRLIEDVIRKAGEPYGAKHHEVSQALQALERVQQALAKSAQPVSAPPEKG